MRRRCASASELGGDYGHVELVYDFAQADGGSGDGWLHALFRYRHRDSGHVAETSFGAHVFNTLLVYRGEPQSYAGPPPGLSTRLFLRLGDERVRHAVPSDLSGVAPVAAGQRHRDHPARPRSAARSRAPLWRFRVPDRACSAIASCSTPTTRARAGDGAYAIIRDTTCRLFGYHGLLGRDGAFSLDHMFGF